ncbi:hypothetical protein V8G54_011544, partial [Vigna mungo]
SSSPIICKPRVAPKQPSSSSSREAPRVQPSTPLPAIQTSSSSRNRTCSRNVKPPRNRRHRPAIRMISLALPNHKTTLRHPLTRSTPTPPVTTTQQSRRRQQRNLHTPPSPASKPDLQANQNPNRTPSSKRLFRFPGAGKDRMEPPNPFTPNLKP